MKRNGLVIGALVAAMIAVAAYAQDKPAAPSPTPTMQGHMAAGAMGGMAGGTMGSMMAEDKAMMAERQRMTDVMDANDATLNRLVAQMNAADGTEKIDAIAAVIAELVAQEKRARHQMMSMGPEMMQHMMAHMKSGTMSGMEKSMAMCPMMQGAGASKADEPKADGSDHAKHHTGTQK